MQSHGSTPTARVPSATHERAAGSNLCCWPCLSSLRVCVYSRPLPPHWHLQLAPTAKHVHTRFWPPLLPELEPRRQTRVPQVPQQPLQPTADHSSPQEPCIIDVVDNIDNEPTSHTPWTQRFYSHPYLTPHTTRATAIAHSRLPSLTSEGIYFFLKSVQKVWKRWLLLQMQVSVHGYREHKNWGNRTPPKKMVNFSAHLQDVWTQQLIQLRLKVAYLLSFSSKSIKMINRGRGVQSTAAMLAGLLFHVLDITKIRTLSRYSGLWELSP